MTGSRFRTRLRGAAAVATLALAAGCARSPYVPLPDLVQPLGDEVIRGATAEAPPGSAPGTCWGRDIQPARLETVTEQVMVQPPEIGADGVVRSPAVFRTETRSAILRDREPILFPAPCPEEMTPDFVATLQRALAARGLYDGPVTGRMDGATRAAVRAFQRPQGLDSSVLSVSAARQLGLVAYDEADF